MELQVFLSLFGLFWNEHGRTRTNTRVGGQREHQRRRLPRTSPPDKCLVLSSLSPRLRRCCPRIIGDNAATTGACASSSLFSNGSRPCLKASSLTEKLGNIVHGNNGVATTIEHQIIRPHLRLPQAKLHLDEPSQLLGSVKPFALQSKVCEV